MKVAALKTLNHNLNKIGLSRQYWPDDMRVLKSEGGETAMPSNRGGNIVKDRMQDFLNLDDHFPKREIKTQNQKRRTQKSDKSFHFIGDGAQKPLTVKSSKTPNQNDVERYN